MKAFPTAVLSALVVLRAMGARGDGSRHPGGMGGANLHQTAPRFLFYDYRSNARLAAGVLGELSGRGRWGLRLEPMYAGEGSRFLDPRCPCLRPEGYVPKQNELRLSYLELPLLVAFSLGRGRVRPCAGGRNGEPSGERRVAEGWARD